MLSTIFITIITVIISVLLHYEFLYQLTKFKIEHRFSLVFVVLIILISHVLQIMLFALAFYLTYHLGLGELANPIGQIHYGFFDFVYFSFTTFSTLGYGDINPIHYLKILAGVEALLGFVLITWSASFLYYEMQKYWQPQNER